MELNIAETMDGVTHAYEGYRTLCGVHLGSCDRWFGHPPYSLLEAPGHRRCTPDVTMQSLPELPEVTCEACRIQARPSAMTAMQGHQARMIHKALTVWFQARTGR